MEFKCVINFESFDDDDDDDCSDDDDDDDDDDEGDFMRSAPLQFPVSSTAINRSKHWQAVKTLEGDDDSNSDSDFDDGDWFQN